MMRESDGLHGPESAFLLLVGLPQPSMFFTVAFRAKPTHGTRVEVGRIGVMGLHARFAAFFADGRNENAIANQSR